MIQQLPVSKIQPNDWNPNEMSEAEFAELVSEVKHLGCLPKPVVVRGNGDGYTIVDGEHGWRAAKETGLVEVPCEVVDADDFEARRQTFKRNQHGTHNPVLLGRMFRQMTEERGLSNRALAEEIAVSEGTVRNALLYAEAEAMRNDYAQAEGLDEDADDILAFIANLSIREVRMYCALPDPIQDYWLPEADVGLIEEAMPHDPEMSLREEWGFLIDSGLDAALKESKFSYAKTLWEMWEFIQKHSRRLPNLKDYVLVAAKAGFMAKILDALPVNTQGGEWSVLVSPDRWAEILASVAERAKTIDEAKALVNAMVRLDLREMGKDIDFTDPRVMDAEAALQNAPEYIWDSNIDLQEKLDLVGMDLLVPDDLADEVKKEAIKSLETRDLIASGRTGNGTLLPANVRDAAMPYWAEMTLKEAVQCAAEKIGGEHALKERDAIFASRSTLTDAAIGALKEQYQVRAGLIDGKPVHEVMRLRLDALPEPEFTLLAAYITGNESPALSFWAKALGVTISDPHHKNGEGA